MTTLCPLHMHKNYINVPEDSLTSGDKATAA